MNTPTNELSERGRYLLSLAMKIAALKREYDAADVERRGDGENCSQSVTARHAQ